MTETTISPKDEYMYFTWRGISSEVYNCFIVNEKHSLEFVNAPSFSNNYATTLYQNKSYFLGTSVERKTLTFKVSCDRITLKEYREFLAWLNIYSIGILALDYDDWYGYNVKLSAITESNKYPLYKCDNEMVYSIITTLTFETTDDFYAIHKYQSTGIIQWDADSSKFVINSTIFNNDENDEDTLGREEVLMDYKIGDSQYFYLLVYNFSSLDTTFQLASNNINGSLLFEKIETEDTTLATIIAKDDNNEYNHTYLGFIETNNLDTNYTLSLEYDSGSGQTISYGILSPRLEVQGQLAFQNIDMKSNITIPANSDIVLKITYTPIVGNSQKPDFAIQFQKRTQVI